MNIDNLGFLKNFLRFEDELDFYYIFIVRRRKDAPKESEDLIFPKKIIKSYTVSSIEYLEEIWPEIKIICKAFNARAYISVERQNHKNMGFLLMQKIAKQMECGQFNFERIFSKTRGSLKSKEHRWILDIDKKDLVYLEKIKTHLNQMKFRPNIFGIMPTPNGYHIIISKFSATNFSKNFPEIEIKKGAFTLAYYNNE